MKNELPTYQERVNRYRVVKHEELPEYHQICMRKKGIDPDDNWSLVWSFERLEDAEAQLTREREYAPGWQTWKIIDAGAAEVVTRTAWF